MVDSAPLQAADKRAHCSFTAGIGGVACSQQRKGLPA